MSLQVWLPLNGDLRNQGTSNASITNTSATINTTGKIGSCYQFGTGKSYLKFNNVDFIHDFTECSVSLWLKILSWNTSYATYFQLGLGSTPWTHYIFGLLRNNTASTLCFTISNGSSATNASCLTPALDLNTWYHLTLTYSDGHCKIYVNGIETKDYSTTIVPNFAGITTGTIGAANNLTGYQTNCLINDFRIYDHCLSAAEVKEISQGLVLHYKLDSPFIENTINYTPSPYKESYSAATPAWDTSKHTNAIIPNNWGQGYNGGVADPSHGYHAMWNIIDGIPTIVLQNHNSIINQKNRWMGVSSAGINIAIAANVKYTISYEQRTLDTLGGYTTCGLYYKYNSSASNGFHDGCPKIGQNTVVNTWERFSYTFTRKSTVDGTGTNGSIYIYGHNGTESTMQVRNIQLEIKDHTTGYTITERNNQIIEDSSGYNYNGTITGTISIDSDSPRYQSSIYVNGSSYILTPAGSFAWNDLTQLTFSAWMKPTDSMSGWRGSVGIAADTTQTARGIAITDYGNAFRGTYTNGSTYATIATGKALPQNEWHHCAGTLNGTEFKLYFDGALVKTQTIDWGTATLNANARFEVGVDLPGTNEKFTGNYSDVRCYCTALDADAIRQLYEVGAKIDNKGNTHTYEFIEHQDNILFPAELSRTKLEFTNGLSRYTQSNCQVTLVEEGYHIYRPPNLTTSANGNTMFGGLKLVNQSTDTVSPYNAVRDNIWNLQKGHSYILAFHAKGQSSNAHNYLSFNNNMGWGVGGVSPAPTLIAANGILADFQGEKDCYYAFTINDDIVKTSNDARAGYDGSSQYLSYRHFTFGWTYSNTGALGTDIYLTNFRLYDITTHVAQFTKQGIANFSQFIEQMDKAQIRKNSELLSSEFIEL